MLTDDIGVRISLDALATGIPAGDDAVRLQHVDGVVDDALNLQAKTSLDAFALLRFGDQLRRSLRDLRLEIPLGFVPRCSQLVAPPGDLVLAGFSRADVAALERKQGYAAALVLHRRERVSTAVFTPRARF